MKWRSKATGVEPAWVRDSWDAQKYLVAISFDGSYDAHEWIRIPYSEFIEAFERVEDA